MKRESKQVSADDSGIMRAFRTYSVLCHLLDVGEQQMKKLCVMINIHMYMNKNFILYLRIHCRWLCIAHQKYVLFSFRFNFQCASQATPFECIVDYGCLCTIKCEFSFQVTSYHITSHHIAIELNFDSKTSSCLQIHKCISKSFNQYNDCRSKLK